MKLSPGRRPGSIALIQASKRVLRLRLRLERTFTGLSPAPAPAPTSPSPPPKLPQFSDTDARSFSMPGGETTCSQTRPRSLVIDDMRSSHGSSRRSSLQSLREQTVVASSDTFSRCVFANSEKMLFGWSPDVGSLSSSGRLPSMIAGWARSVES